MKLVKAVVREDVLQRIDGALAKGGFSGYTVMSAAGRGAVPKIGTFRGSRYTMLDRVSVIEILVPDGCAETAIDILLEHAHTGMHGDGYVTVMNVDEVYAVRTRWRVVA